MELDTLLTNPVVIFHKACQFVICIFKNKIYRYKELLILIAIMSTQVSRTLISLCDKISSFHKSVFCCQFGSK